MHPEIDRTPPPVTFPRRDLLRTGALGLFGLGLPDIAAGAGGQSALAQAREGVHRPLHVGRAGPAGYLGPEARCAGGLSRRVQAHPDDRPRTADLRTPADAGGPRPPVCLIRSMTHNDVNHTTATHHLLTGKPAPARTAYR